MSTAQLGTLVQHLRRLADSQRAAELDDAPLLEAFSRRRDEAAFAALLHRHAPLVYGVCRRVLGNTHDAEDAFQATFLILVRKAGSVRAGESLGCWLHEIAFRTALRARAVAHKRRARERRAQEMSETSPKPTPETRDVEALLDEELNRLPEQYRRPLVLCYLEGKTHVEAAALLGWPKGTVSGRLARARDLLRSRLARRGVSLTAGALLAALTNDANAAVPYPLMDATLRTGLSFAGGRAGDGAAVTLAKEVLQVMATNKLRLAVLALAMIGLLGGGWAYLARSGEPLRQTAAFAGTLRGQDRESLPAGATVRMGSTAFRHGDRILYLAYTADGKRLITSGMDQTVRLWDSATGRELRRFDRSPHPKEKDLPGRARKMPLGAMIVPDDFRTAASADGKFLAATRNDVVILWELDSGKELHRFRGPWGGGTFLAFANDGKILLAADHFGNVESWDVATGKLVKGIPVPNSGAPNALVGTGPAVSGDGKLLALPYADPQNAVFPVRLYDLVAGKELHKIEVGAVALSLAFSPDGKTLAAGTVKGEVNFWDVATGKESGSLKADRIPDMPVSLAFAPNGRELALSRSLGAVELWDVRDRKRLCILLGNNVPVQPFQGFFLGPTTRIDLAFRPDGKRLATGAFRSGVSLFDPATGKESGSETSGNRVAVGALGLSPDGKTLLTYARGDAVRFWDLESGKGLRRVAVPAGASSAALSADGSTLASVTGSGATGFQLMLYDPVTGKPKAQQLRNAEGLATSLAFSPDGKTLAARGNRSKAVRIWDVATGKDYPTPDGESYPDTQEMFPIGRSTRVRYAELAFSPEGRYLALADAQDQLALFDVARGTRLLSFPLERGQVVRRFGFSPDGHCLATVNQDGTVTLYEAATGRKRARFGKAVPSAGPSASTMLSAVMIETPSAEEIPYALAFSPDGRVVAASGPGPKIRLSDVLTDKEVATFRGHQGGVTALAFDAFGRRLVSGSLDTTALSWDVAGPAKALRPPRGKIAEGRADDLWSDLAGADAERAFAAIRALCEAPADAVEMLKKRLRPVIAPDPKLVARLIRDLDTKSFAARTKAAAELEAIGDLIGPAARRAVAEGATLEVRQRLEPLLKKIRVRAIAGETLAALRGVEVLEKVGSAEARRFLEFLAAGAEGARLTEAARDAVRRLKGSGVVSP